MHTHIITRAFAILSLAGTCFTWAAGSGGGGFTGTPAPMERKSPEQISESHYKAGVKHKEKAWKFEETAAKASNEKKRDKALEKAAKAYAKAIEAQGRALQADGRNYKAANELGYALRQTGDYGKAIGAYNYALELNPNFMEAVEYRGEAFLKLGYLKETQQAYMRLFRNDPALAAQLMDVIDGWIAEKTADGASPSADELAFAQWAGKRKQLARYTKDLSQNNTRTW